MPAQLCRPADPEERVCYVLRALDTLTMSVGPVGGRTSIAAISSSRLETKLENDRLEMVMSPPGDAKIPNETDAKTQYKRTRSPPSI